MEAKVTTEILYHINCSICKGYWSVTDRDLKENQHINCPYCRAQLIITFYNPYNQDGSINDEIS